MFFFFSFFSVSKITIKNPGYHSFITSDDDEIEIDLKSGKLSSIIIFPNSNENDISFSVQSITGQNKVSNIKDFHALRINGKSANFILRNKLFLQIWLFNSTLCQDGSILYKTENTLSDNFLLDQKNKICTFFANNGQIKNSMQCQSTGHINTYSTYFETEVKQDGACSNQSKCEINAQIPRFMELSNCSSFDMTFESQTPKNSYIKGCGKMWIPVLENGVFNNQSIVPLNNVKCETGSGLPTLLVISYVIFACFVIAVVAGIVLTCAQQKKDNLVQQETELLKDDERRNEGDSIKL